MRGVLAAVVTVGLTGLSGCRFEQVAPPPPWSATSAAVSTVALPYRVAVAPVRASARELLSRHAGVLGRHGSVPDPQTLRRGVIEALRATGAFERVEPRDGAALGDVAWAAGDDLILELEVVDHYQEYLGHSNYVGWFLAYASFVWPAWWIPVDYYGGGLQVKARLRNVQEQAAPVLERSYEVRPTESQRELTPSDRELAGLLDWGALWNVEASLDESNWRAIERAVAPHARRQFEEALLRDLEAQVVRPINEGADGEREAVLARIRKRFAVVVGVSAYADPVLGGGAHAAEDARALAALFQRSEGGGLVAGRDLTVLVDEQATRSAVLDAIAAVTSRASPTDEVVIYLAGLGAGLRGGAATAPAVLLHDARSDDLAGSALLLDDLGRALGALRPQRVALIFDTSFGGAAAGVASRTLADSTAASGAVDPSDVLRALRLREGWAALLPSAPGQPACVLPGAQTGLFGEVLRAAIGGAADVDEDGRVTLVEAFEHAQAGVAGRASLEGFQQEPVVLGSLDAGGLAWPR